MGAIESAVIAVAVFGVVLGLTSGFYTDFSTETGHTATPVTNLQQKANISGIKDQAVKIIGNQTQQQSSDPLIIGQGLLATGLGIFSITFSIPSTILGVLMGVSELIPSGIIPGEIYLLIYIVILMIFVFAIARLYTARNDG